MLIQDIVPRAKALPTVSTKKFTRSTVLRPHPIHIVVIKGP
jgi:hypothetical protein